MPVFFWIFVGTNTDEAGARDTPRHQREKKTKRSRNTRPPVNMEKIDGRDSFDWVLLFLVLTVVGHEARGRMSKIHCRVAIWGNDGGDAGTGQIVR